MGTGPQVRGRAIHYEVVSEVGGMEETENLRFRQIDRAASTSPAYQPGFVVRPSASMDGRADAKFGMIISLGGGVIALVLGIWTFMISDADSDVTFLWLSLGAAVAVAATFALVEVQHRRQGALSILHDYLLAFGLLFGMLGAFWISRYGLFFACGHGAGGSGFCQGESGASDWMPGAWGVAAQVAIIACAAAAFWAFSSRVEGGTLPRLVLVLSPLALLLVGANVWVNWAEGEASLPLLIGVLTMAILSMAMATLSNRSPLFIASAIICSLAPFVYEANLTGPAGAGLSMLVIIVLVQGVFAAHPGLSRPMIEKGSIALVSLVIIGQWVTGAADAQFILLRTIEHPWITLQLVLWLALLFGYFWAVHLNRVPSMPIGLGFALLLIPSPGSMLAWCLALMAFVYMLTVPQTRRWVADWTFIAMMFAWWAGDWFSSEGLGELALDPLFIAVPPLALIVIGYFGVREKRLSSSVHNVGLLLVLLSHELLVGSGPWLPLGIAAFLTLLVWQQARQADEIIAAGEGARMEATGRVAMAVAGILVLELAGRLAIPGLDVRGLHIEAMVLALLLYIFGRGLQKVEVDLGELIAKVGGVATTVPEWDAATNTWIQTESMVSKRLASLRLGPAARLGLAGPLLLFSLALSNSGDPAQLHLIGLLVVPIAILLNEILNELPNDDRTRAAGVWILFLIGIPTSLALHNNPADHLTEAVLLFDGLLLAGPVLGDILLRKRGLSGEKDMGSGSIALAGLLGIALLDTSGGLLALPIFAIVLMRGYMHRQSRAIEMLGLAWLVWIWTLDLGSAALLINRLPEVAFLAEIAVLNLPRWAGIGLIVAGLPSLIGHLTDRRAAARGEEVDEISHPLEMPAIFVVFGAFLLVPDAHWFAVIAILLVSLGAWSVGALDWFWFSGFALFISLIYAGDAEWDLSSRELFRFAGGGTFAYNAVIFIVDQKGRFFRTDDERWTPERRLLLIDTMVITAFISSIIADDLWYGAALVAGAVLMTRYAHERRWSDLLVLLPVAHAWVIARVLAGPLPDAATEIAGFVMLIESMGLTWASWQMYDFEWNEWTDEQVISHSDRSGWAGALLFVPAAWLIATDLDLWLFGGMLCVHSAGQMALGFQRDENWRRIYSMIGVAVGFIIIAVDIEDGIMRGVMLVLASLTMMMQGILYMTRAGIEMSGTGIDPTLPEEITEEPPEENPEEASEDIQEVDESESEPESEPESCIEDTIPMPVQPRIIGDNFDVELPADVRSRIEAAILATEHQGFRAVIRWDHHGQVILDWEPAPF